MINLNEYKGRFIPNYLAKTEVQRHILEENVAIISRQTYLKEDLKVDVTEDSGITFLNGNPSNDLEDTLTKEDKAYSLPNSEQIFRSAPIIFSHQGKDRTLLAPLVVQPFTQRVIESGAINTYLSYRITLGCDEYILTRVSRVSSS
ncbi:MAG: hypothetical protein KKA62_00795 [Nanoarchaeota archaeon]|nr:hypothetical protein [Nanoarchaeota archaeon]MBU1644467.1 hypothetical protein [Nanoarchaeota archaeon]MBU1976471.1 hypothetical protein [Nanoarchaeota archaeon]